MTNPFGRIIVFAASLFAFISSAQTYLYADRIFVVNDSHFPVPSVVKFDSSGNGSEFPTGLSVPQGIAFDGAGNLYVANRVFSIAKFNPDESFSLFKPLFESLEGLAFDSSGNLFGVSGSSIMRFDSNLNASTFANVSFTSYAIAADHLGNLYATSFFYNKVFKIDSNGNASVFIDSGIPAPAGLAFDANDNLYISSDSDGTIRKLDPNGSSSIFASNLVHPHGLAFDSGGNLYATSYNGTNSLIYKFDPAGNMSVFADSNLYDPAFIAITSIPEPATWLLMALGTGALLGDCRLRRRTPRVTS